MRQIAPLVSAVLLAGVLACLSGAPVMAAPASAGPPAATNTGGADAYALGSGDKLKLYVYGETDISGGEYLVDGLGFVSLPLIGQVHVAGLTKTAVEQIVTDKYHAGYLNDPKVNIEIINFRPFYILGEVQKPGEYPYTNGQTVMSAVATAGGFTYRANTHKVYVKPAGQSKDQVLPLDSGTPVHPGDTIRIGERFF